MGIGIWELWWAGWKATGCQVPRQHLLGALQTWDGSVSVGGKTQQAWGSSYLPMGRGAFLNLTTRLQDFPSKIVFFGEIPNFFREISIRATNKEIDK